MDNIQSYSKDGRSNCLHNYSYNSCKILLSLSDELKISKISIYYEKELEKKGYIDNRSFMYSFISC